MPNNNQCIILFYTIHDVLKAEKILKKHHIAHELVPVPRNLSSDCGMCVKSSDDPKNILPLLSTIEISGCFDTEGNKIQ